MKIRCCFCRLPNPLRRTVEEGLGQGTMPYRRASRMTGLALSSLHRHMANHWGPPVEKPPPPQPPSEEVVPPKVSRSGPQSSPCVIEVMDQAQIAQLRAKKYPAVHSLEAGWEQVIRGWRRR